MNGAENGAQQVENRLEQTGAESGFQQYQVERKGSGSSSESSNQCIAAATSANRTLGMIRRTFINKDSKLLLRLYQSLVRP